MQGILIIILFFIFAFLMYKQKISTFLALIFMALLFAVVGGVPLSGKTGILEGIVASGATMLAESIVAVVFGAWLGEVLNETGITRDIVRRAAELGGDKPIVLAVIMSMAVGVLFTALTGLGSVIMVGTLVLPILSAAGIKPIVAGTMYLFARTIGLVINLTTWQVFINITKLPLPTIRDFGFVASAFCVVGVLAFIFFELRSPKVAWSLAAPPEKGQFSSGRKVPAIALMTPLIPFPLVIFFQWPIVPALFVGCLFGVLSTAPRDSLRILTKTIHEGVKSAVPAIILFIIIGMVLKAVSNPQVSNSLLAVCKAIVPSDVITYLAFFIVLAPLALYRGPLNIYGLGSGVLGLLVSINYIPAAAVAAGFMATLIVELAGDPTNTQNVWVSDFLGLEVNDITRKALPYLWAVCTGCVIAGAFIYF